MFRYTRAIVCGVPASLPAAALRQETDAPVVDLGLARKQHKEYVDVLEKEMGLEIVHIEVREEFPDCVFVEDPLVVCGDTALITIPGHASRRGEVVALREAAGSLGLKVVEMKDPGLMDGGDVLFTGREFFVGLSSRTNKEGIAQLGQCFPNYPVTPIPVSGSLHLKSFCSMASPQVIAIGISEIADKAREIIKNEGKFQYEFLSLPSNVEANCVFVNDVLIYAVKGGEEVSPFDALPCKKVPLPLPELNKVDGCFTCCSVLIP